MTHSSFILLFSDSEVAAVTLANGNVRILFSAAHVLRYAPNDFEKLIEGFARNVELVLSATMPGLTLNEFMGRISSGRIFVENQWARQAAFPHTISGPIKLELSFANQSHLDIETDGLECRFIGESNFFESMAC
ncbi:hypothetical protein [Azohydromonas lata]|uniref:hypothetical protein n=1 Tax=Azohydromonas lata TaxID=45677 RepID=UPI0012F4BF92|nr:hypothetical protein [Azohydromonas lata]